ncbi:hypothetical protein E3T33_01870 [Cryobacterium sp. TMT1-2-1]|nr:hypothetical protein E3T33_01870 [Cryobacterium sp. TMT1-2-1]
MRVGSRGHAHRLSPCCAGRFVVSPAAPGSIQPASSSTSDSPASARSRQRALSRGIFTGGAGVGGRVLSILLGVFLAIAGIIAIRNPLSSLALLTMVIGISWIIEGVVGLVETSHDSSRWFGWLFGIVAIVAGTVLLLTPIESLGVLVWIGGTFLVGSGVIQLVQAFTFGKRARTHGDSR